MKEHDLVFLKAVIQQGNIDFTRKQLAILILERTARELSAQTDSEAVVTELKAQVIELEIQALANIEEIGTKNREIRELKKELKTVRTKLTKGS